MMQQWKFLFCDIIRVYKIYGGINAFIMSPCVHISLMISLVVLTFKEQTWDWYTTTLSVFPSTVGFSLAAYALSLTFGNQKFHDAIRGKDEHEVQIEENCFSPYIKISSSFAHFVLTQFLALILAALSNSLAIKCFFIAFLGIFLFYYALLLGVVITLNLFFLSDMYDKMPKDTFED